MVASRWNNTRPCGAASGNGMCFSAHARHARRSSTARLSHTAHVAGAKARTHAVTTANEQARLNDYRLWSLRPTRWLSLDNSSVLAAWRCSERDSVVRALFVRGDHWPAARWSGTTCHGHPSEIGAREEETAVAIRNISCAISSVPSSQTQQ